MHDLSPLGYADTQPSRSPDTAQRASNDTSAGSLVLKQQSGCVDAEEEDTHDWESFNAQIERLLQSMQKSDRAVYQAQSSMRTPRQSVPQTAGSTQPAFASVLGNAALRQNLAETAFELAARSPFQASRNSEPSAGSAADAAAAIATGSLQSYDEGAANGEEESHSSVAQAEVLQQSVSGAHCSKVSAALGHAAKGRITPPEHDGSASPYLPLLQQIDWHIASCDASLASINTRAETCASPNADSQRHGVLSAEKDGRASPSLESALAAAASTQTEGMKAHNSGMRPVIEAPFRSTCARSNLPIATGRPAAMQMHAMLNASSRSKERGDLPCSLMARVIKECWPAGAISLEGLVCMHRELSVSLPSSEALQAALTAHAQSPQRNQGSAQLAWNAQDAQGAANAEEEDVCPQNDSTASASSQSHPQTLPDLSVRAEGSTVLPAQQTFTHLQTEYTHGSLRDMPAQPSPAPSTAAQHSVYGNDLFELPSPASPAHLDVLEDAGNEQQPQLIPAHWPESLAVPHAAAPSSAMAAGAQFHANRERSQALVIHTEAGEQSFCSMLHESADADSAAGASQSSQAAAAEEPLSPEAGSSPVGSSFRILRLSLSPPSSSHKEPPSPGDDLPGVAHISCAVNPCMDKLNRLLGSRLGCDVQPLSLSWNNG